MKSLIVLLILILPHISSAKDDFSGFVGVGPGLSLPGPIRLRFYNVEVGTYGIAVGVVSSYREEHIYAQFGGGISALGKMDTGLIGAFGTEYNLFWKIATRGEFFTFFGTSGVAYSAATVGLSISF